MRGAAVLVALGDAIEPAEEAEREAVVVAVALADNRAVAVDLLDDAVQRPCEQLVGEPVAREMERGLPARGEQRIAVAQVVGGLGAHAGGLGGVGDDAPLREIVEEEPLAPRRPAVVSTVPGVGEVVFEVRRDQRTGRRRGEGRGFTGVRGEVGSGSVLGEGGSGLRRVRIAHAARLTDLVSCRKAGQLYT